MATDKEIEQEIQDKGLNAPRVTLDSIEDKIITEDYHVFPGTTVTVCALTLRNGYVVIGHSAAASPKNFDEELGKKIARQKCIDEMWALEGYLLKEDLSREEVYFIPDPARMDGWKRVGKEEYQEFMKNKEQN